MIGTFGGQIKTDTFGFGGVVDAVAACCHRSLWRRSRRPGIPCPASTTITMSLPASRFRRDMPTLDDKFHEYFKYDNILDEFDGSRRPLCALQLRRRGPARRASGSFPTSYKFYNDIDPTLTAEFDILDDARPLLDAQRLRSRQDLAVFMVRDGKLSAFDADYHPVGEPLALESLRAGVNHSQLSIRLRRLGMNFGLDDLSFTNRFTRDDQTTTFQAQMDAVPHCRRAARDPAGGRNLSRASSCARWRKARAECIARSPRQALADGAFRFSSDGERRVHVFPGAGISRAAWATR